MTEIPVCDMHTDKETTKMLDELNKMTAEEVAQFDTMTEVREECLRRARKRD